MNRSFQKLTENARPFTLKEAEGEGVSRQTLQNWLARGLVERVARGIYAPANMPPWELFSLQLAALMAPEGVVCLTSALAYYDLTDHLPKSVTMALPPGRRRVDSHFPPVRYVNFKQIPYGYGIQQINLNGISVPIYSAAKTIVDCFMHADKVGLPLAMAALKEASRRKLFTGDELYQAISVCSMEEILPLWQMLHS